MTRYQLVALTNAVEGREDEFNEWYDNQHLNDVLNVPGFYRAQRFINANAFSPDPPEHKYMAIYEFETDDLARTVDYFLSVTSSGKMPISSAMDATKASPAIYRVLGPAKERSAPTPWPD